MPKKSETQSIQLSVIMPAYNEGMHIHENILKVCETLKDHLYEIIVVDDGSQDNTYSESLRAVNEGYPIKVIHQKDNRGKGATLFRGFEFTSGRLIAFIDSDLEIGPESILNLWNVMTETSADVVVGVKNPVENRFPFFRRSMSIIYRWVVSFLFGLNITDTQTGIKLFKRAVLEAAIPRLSISRFAFDIELLVAVSRLGYTIIEHPVKVSFHRRGSLGRMNFGHILGTFIDTLAIYNRASFWRWLEPSLATRLWMVFFVLGVFLFGIGVGKILTPIILRPPLKDIAHFIFLQFLPARLRDWLLAIGGFITLILSLIQLNKGLLSAFANRDRGDLAGILRK